MRDMGLYYNFDRLLSYNAFLNFVVSERGVGKTFNSKVLVLNKFLNKGEEFIYLRRYKTELDSALITFWSDIQSNGYFEDYDLRVKRNKMITKFTCNGETCGYAVPLSTANILKSTAFPKVKTIIFDEFMLNDSGSYKYLKDEVTLFLDVVETVARLRDIQVIFLGNALSITNPYFIYFGLELPYNSEFKTFKDGLIVVNYVKNIPYREAKKKTRFGQLISDTEYSKYAIDNVMLRDNPYFIEKMPPDGKFYGVLIINGVYVGIWSSKNGYLYLSDKYDPNTTHKFACDFDDHTEQTIFANARWNMYIQVCIRAYRQGLLRFENQKIKNVATSILNKCLL